MYFCSGQAATPSPTSDNLSSVSADEHADALAFALRYRGRKRVHDSAEIMAARAAKRLVEHLERSGFVIMRKPSELGGLSLGRVFEKG